MGPRSGLLTVGCPARLRRAGTAVAAIGADIGRFFVPEGLEPAPIRLIQTALAQQCYDPGPTDGRDGAMTPALGGTCHLGMTVVDVLGSVEELADGTGGSVDAVTKGGGRSKIPAEEGNGYV
jgi:hypothetical protein